MANSTSDGAIEDPMGTVDRGRALRRFLFRFGLVYFLIYAHPFPLWLIPTPSGVAQVFEYEADWVTKTEVVDKALGDYSNWYRNQERAAVDLAAKSVFGIERTLDRPYGSGDPLYSYIRLLLHLVFAGLVAAVWSRLASGRGTYERLGAWLLIGLRLWVAFAMLSYGLSKVLPTQFPGWVRLDRLLAPWGDSTPMSVIWTTMRSSEAYTIFGGAGEVVGGALLLFRRTSTLGALVTAGVMANVVAMNFCFDVPVKLYSSHLCLGALAVASPDLRRLLAVLVQNRATAPRSMTTPHLPWTGSFLKILAVAIFVVPGVRRRLDSMAEDAVLPQHYGIWDVQEFEIGGEVQQPLAGDTGVWKLLTIDRNDRCSVYRLDGTRMGQALERGEDGGITLKTDSDWEVEVSGDELVLTGHFGWRFMAGVGADPSETPRENRAPQYRVVLTRVAAPAPDGEEQPEPWVGTWRTDRVETIGDRYTPRSQPAPSRFAELEFDEEGVLRVTLPSGRVDEFTWERQQHERPTLRFTTETKLALVRDGGSMELTGDYRGHALRVSLKERDLQEFMLLRRGFHWVNPIPFNRY